MRGFYKTPQCLSEFFSKSSNVQFVGVPVLLSAPCLGTSPHIIYSTL